MATIQMRPEHRQEFLKAMLEDARGSNDDERGCLRFDVLQDVEDRNRIHLLIEVYLVEAAFEAHLTTPHFLK